MSETQSICRFNSDDDSHYLLLTEIDWNEDSVAEPTHASMQRLDRRMQQLMGTFVVARVQGHCQDQLN